VITSRKALLGKLRTLEPAVAEMAIVPGYTHFLFTGDRIVAHNERIAMSVRQPSDFVGLIPAGRLLDLLAVSTSPAVGIKEAGSAAVQVRLGESAIRLPMKWVGCWRRFYMPEIMPQHRVPAAFLHGVEHCLLSINSYASVPDQLGITLIQDGRDIRLFSTRCTISTARLPPPFRLNERVILSTEFCEQMLVLAKSAKTLRFEVVADHALFTADDTLLWGRLIELSPTPLDFVGVIKRMPKDFDSKAIRIPRELRAVLKRLARVTCIAGNETGTRVVIKDGVATFTALSERGRVIDKIKLPRHPDVKMNINARLLLDGYKAAPDRILFMPECAILARGEHYFLVATFDDD
jgi:hypothetical protein